MAGSAFVMYEAEQKEIQAVIERLTHESRAKACFVIDKNGQALASSGQVAGLDITSLASLTAGSISATGGLARVLGEKGDFTATYNEGDRDNLYMTIVGQRIILVVTFNNDTSSLGLVRLRVKKASDELAGVIQRIVAKSETGEAPLGEITDDDIDNLFS
jgi:predicted regulator of Ras-like GTPase activity (Roadblock/LC7/MglB family)